MIVTPGDPALHVMTVSAVRVITSTKLESLTKFEGLAIPGYQFIPFGNGELVLLQGLVVGIGGGGSGVGPGLRHGVGIRHGRPNRTASTTVAAAASIVTCASLFILTAGLAGVWNTIRKCSGPSLTVLEETVIAALALTVLEPRKAVII